MAAGARICWAALALVGCDVSRPIQSPDPAGCATFPTRFLVATSCELGIVDVTVAQTECSVRLVFEGMERAVIEGELAADGALAIHSDVDATPCLEVPPRTGALRRIECVRATVPCGYDLYAPTPPEAVTVDEARVLPVTFRAPERVMEGRNRPLDGPQALEGYLTSMVVIGETAWVATASLAFANVRHRGPSTLVRVDGTGLPLAVDAPIAAPDGLRELALDPLDPTGFIGVSGGAAPMIHRFDARGRVVASVPLMVPASRDAQQAVVPITLVAGSPGSGVIEVVMSTQEKRFESWILEVDARSFAHRRTSLPGPNPVRAISTPVRRRLFAADHDGGQLVPFRLDDGGIDVPFVVNVIGGPTDDAGALAVHPGSEQLVVSTTGEVPLVYFADERESMPIRGFARFFEGDVLPWAIAPRPDAPEQMAVGVTAQAAPFTAWVARLVVPEQRFLPGAVAVGQGVVRQIIPDVRGRLWVLLPWSGRVVRLR